MRRFNGEQLIVNQDRLLPYPERFGGKTNYQRLTERSWVPPPAAAAAWYRCTGWSEGGPTYWDQAATHRLGFHFHTSTPQVASARSARERAWALVRHHSLRLLQPQATQRRPAWESAVPFRAAASALAMAARSSTTMTGNAPPRLSAPGRARAASWTVPQHSAASRRSFSSVRARRPQAQERTFVEPRPCVPQKIVSAAGSASPIGRYSATCLLNVSS